MSAFYRYKILLFFVIGISTTMFSQETFRDNFGSVSYSNNDGTQNWSTDWVETGDTDLGPTNTFIEINNNRLNFYYNWGEAIRRTANLNGATTATLSFSWGTNGLNGGKGLSVQVSNNGGASYTTVGTVSGNNSSGNFSTNIAAFISTNTTIRFTYNGNNWDGNDSAYVDNVQVSVNQLSPFLEVTDTTIDENLGNVVVTITHNGGNATGSYSVNYTTVDGSAIAGIDYSSTSGTLNFNGVSGDTDTAIIPILDDALIEGSENFILDLVSSSLPSVNISDTGTITINDDEVLANTPLALVREFNGNFDYTSTGGSLRTLPNNNGTNDACQIQSTSQAPLLANVPVGATIKKAYLYWAHSNSTVDNNVTFEGQNVTADVAYTTFITTRQFYGYVSDVTDIVTSKTNLNTTDFVFTDLDIDTSDTYCGSSTVLGGWALMVFYEDPLLPVSTINVYQGFDGLSDDTNSYTLDSFYAISGAGSKASFLSWEGDENIVGAGTGTIVENLSVEVPGDAPVTLSGDGSQTGNNPYNSTIFDNTGGTTINLTNSYGLDWDTYDLTSILDPGDSQFTANVAMGQDFVISNAVVLKVQSNLIAGTVFEDVNYPGGPGRDLATSSGLLVEGATVEIYDNLGNLWNTKTTDVNGEYAFGGMADGTYTIRVVNSSVSSNRVGGSTCTSCFPVQTYRSAHNGTAYNYITDEIGGANPSQEDAGTGTLTGAQSISSVTIAGGGISNINFGFNFNTIVNTNEDGQGSLEQFIVNSNNLDETGLDIEANSIFDPAPGIDTSIFMIPPTGDTLGRTADANFNGSYFDIFVTNGNPFSNITAANTSIDGRTQTAYSGDTNSGTVGSGGNTVGTSLTVLPNYDLPEIQIHRNGGDVIKINANNTIIRNVAVYANNNAGILVNSGSANILDNLLGVNALGSNAGNINIGVENSGGDILVDGNYIATVTDSGILIDGGTSNVIQNNHITTNGSTACNDNISLNSGSGIVIQQNLIENAASLGIDAASIYGNVLVTENTITGSGQDGGLCGPQVEDMGIELAGSNSQITNNIIHSNGGAGISVVGSGAGNLISQNSFYANGTNTPSLGIDLAGDGVSLNDSGDVDSGPNNLLNFPIISTIYKSGSNMVISGWARAGSIIELYSTDINGGTAALGDNQLGLSSDYGEGQVYLATRTEGSIDDTNTNTSLYTDVDGNTDTTNMFTFTIPLPVGIDLGSDITTTATISNSTSEFSPFSKIKAYTVITNRRITYRVKKQ
jgi:hypothetical protein